MASVPDFDVTQFDFKKLSVPVRIELIGKIWDSIDDDKKPVMLSPAQGAELDRRLEEHRRNPDDAIPWEEVKAGLRSRRNVAKG